MMIIDEAYTPKEEEKKTERTIVLPDFGQVEMRLLAEALRTHELVSYNSRPPRKFTEAEIAKMLPPSPGPSNRKERRAEAAQRRRRK